MVSVNPADISLRPVTDRDEAFLRRVHQGARHWEFESLLQSGQADLYHKIMDQQFKTQHEVYFAVYPKAQYGIIQWTGRPVGRLYMDYRDDEVRVLDIAVLPDYRGRGIGGIVMKGICMEAGMRRTPVRLHVHSLSRAVPFYRALGFQRIGVEGPSHLLEWHHPDPDALMRGQFLPQDMATATVST